jgi:predicted lipid-binding transport protein (Tim44 family)
MRLFSSFRAVVAVVTLATAFTLIAVDFADARRGGSFGSRGFRTFDRPAPTRTTPNESRPVDRSMTPRQQQNQPGATQGAAGRQTAAQGSRGLFGGMAGGLLGGLMLGGLIGLLLGQGLGGFAGFLGLLLQVGLVVLVVALVMRFFRQRSQPAFAGAPGQGRDARGGMDQRPGERGDTSRSAYTASPVPPTGGARLEPGAVQATPTGGDEIGLTADDYDTFEQLLSEVQAAFTREDFAALRERCTPEIVSFLSEELGENAVKGMRNEVLDVKLLQGDLSEAWREGADEYATVAMRYESIDVMRDRQTGAVVEGESRPTETTELWTFVRQAGGRWKLSAIQEA